MNGVGFQDIPLLTTQTKPVEMPRIAAHRGVVHLRAALRDTGPRNPLTTQRRRGIDRKVTETPRTLMMKESQGLQRLRHHHPRPKELLQRKLSIKQM